jgi:hypothetical protein
MRAAGPRPNRPGPARSARFGRLVVDPSVLRRGADLDQVTGLADHLEGPTQRVRLVAAGLEHGLRHVVLGDLLRKSVRSAPQSPPRPSSRSARTPQADTTGLIQCARRRCPRRQGFESPTAGGPPLRAQVNTADREQVERDERRRRGRDQAASLGRGRDQAMLEGVERQPTVDEDDQLAIDNGTGRQLGRGRAGDVGEVVGQVALVARPDPRCVLCSADDDAAVAVEFGLPHCSTGQGVRPGNRIDRASELDINRPP